VVTDVDGRRSNPDMPSAKVGSVTFAADPDESDIRRTALLADPTRARLRRLLGASPDGLPVGELATLAGLHHTTVREHLRLMVDAGVVEGVVQPPQGRGRPRTLYRTLPLRVEAYRDLAAILSTAVSAGLSAEEAGRRAGRMAASDATGMSGVDAIVAEARRRGFEPELDAATSTVTLRNCPYAEVAAADPATVCSVHLGFARGVAETIGDVVAESLEIADPHRAGCRLRLRLGAPREQ
jgi:predicted ArsR family transcriptional regulator